MYLHKECIEILIPISKFRIDELIARIAYLCLLRAKYHTAFYINDSVFLFFISLKKRSHVSLLKNFDKVLPAENQLFQNKEYIDARINIFFSGIHSYAT